MDQLAKDMRKAQKIKSNENFIYFASGMLAFAGLCSIIAIPEMLNVKGQEKIKKDGSEYIVQYDKRDNGVVMRKGVPSGIETRVVDTNYDGKADYVYNAMTGSKFQVSTQDQALFSEVTSNFYKMHPTKESLFEKKVEVAKTNYLNFNMETRKEANRTVVIMNDGNTRIHGADYGNDGSIDMAEPVMGYRGTTNDMKLLQSAYDAVRRK